MRVKYTYKDEEFDDIRDIVKNNKLEPDYETITNEYLPFQIFITGRTIFKDVKVKRTCTYNIQRQKSVPSISNYEFLNDKIYEYLNRYNYNKEKTAAAVSGGIDSSVVAMFTSPKIVYSGYYEDDECNELEYSSTVSSALKLKHLRIKLSESDFLDNMSDLVDCTCIPAGGIGSIMEFSALKKAIKYADIDTVLFGNGGDELFLGYFFCHTVKDIHNKLIKDSTVYNYMTNFRDSNKKLLNDIINYTIISGINRAGSESLNSFLANTIFLNGHKYAVCYTDKLLTVTINYILPSLIHLNNQMCKFFNIKGLNPLANKDLINYAYNLNSPMSDIPKKYLRDAHPKLPEKIARRTDKKGFPVPIDKWIDTKSLIKYYSNAFMRRHEVKRYFASIIPIRQSFRYTWGLAQAEIFLRKQKL